MRYDSESLAFEISVRELCEIALKSGDIDYSSLRPNLSDALIEGGEVHRRIQGDAGAFYTPEVFLRNTSLFDGIYYTVSGRADGIIREGGRVIVDEIKSVRGLAFSRPPAEIHLAQMKCYAYFVSVNEELSEIFGRITYAEPESMRIKYFNYGFNVRELREFYLSLLGKIKRYAEFHRHRATEVISAAAQVVFPYPGCARVG